MQQPLISFIIPMYNAQQYVAACIESILDQDLDESEYEIVIVDDGSTDNGKEVVSNYSSIRYCWQNNQGQSSARNRGIENAKGEYVFFVDADDILVPHSIQYILDTARQNDLDMVAFNMVRVKGVSQINTINHITNKENSDISGIMTGSSFMENYNYNNGPCWYIVKRRILIEDGISFVPGRYGEDGMFTMSLLMHISSIVFVDRNCYCYICRSNSTTTRRDISHQKKMLDDYTFVYHYMQSLIKDNASHLSSKAIERCKSRSESYLFFLLIRLMKYPDFKEVKSIVEEMKNNNLYPVKKPYSGLVYSIASTIVNHKRLLFLFNRVYNILPIRVLK